MSPDMTNTLYSENPINLYPILMCYIWISFLCLHYLRKEIPEQSDLSFYKCGFQYLIFLNADILKEKLVWSLLFVTTSASDMTWNCIYIPFSTSHEFIYIRWKNMTWNCIHIPFSTSHEFIYIRWKNMTWNCIYIPFPHVMNLYQMARISEASLNLIHTKTIARISPKYTDTL